MVGVETNVVFGEIAREELFGGAALVQVDLDLDAGSPGRIDGEVKKLGHPTPE